MVGGGSLPEESLPSRAVALGAAALGLPVAEVAARLRLGEPAVVARIEHDRLLLDPRTVQPEEDVALLQVVATHLQR
jgi:L-seryl-tRNA(Ser) seleniumtransferase